MAALVVVLSVMGGLEVELKTRILGSSPHITATYYPSVQPEEPLDWREKAAEFASYPGVKSSYGLIEDYVILEYQGQQQPVNYRAVDTSDPGQLDALGEMLDLEGFPASAADLGFDPEAVISSDLAYSLGLIPGDTFSLYSTRNLKAVKASFEQTDLERVAIAFASELASARETIVSAKRLGEDGQEVYSLVALQSVFDELATIYNGEARQAEKDIVDRALIALSEVGPGDEPDSPDRVLESGFGASLLEVIDELETLDIEQLDEDSLGNVRELVLPKDIVTRGVYRASSHVRNPELFLPMETGQELIGFKDQVQSIALKLHDPLTVDEYLPTIKERLGDDWVAVSWTENFQDYFDLVAREQVMMTLVFFILGLIVTFCISAVMFTVTLQKKKEIGVMKALGATESQIVSVFMVQGVIVGLIGAILGLILGVVFLINRASVHSGLKWVGFDPFPTNFHGVAEIPALFAWDTFINIAVSAFFLCIFAAVVPAIFAAKNDPAKSLRGL